MLPFVRTVTTERVVASAVVDGDEGKVRWDMTSVLAVEAGESEGQFVGGGIDG